MTRPTSDRLRETLFNIIAPHIEGARFLDLCAGSGAVGIEALSRSAAYVTFVDNSRQMVQLIQANLDLCRVGEDEAKVVTTDAAEFLRRRAGRRNPRRDDRVQEQSEERRDQPWTVVFFDPPYEGDHLRVLQLFGGNASVLLDEDGLIVVEHHHKNELPEVVGGLRRFRVLKQGESALSFYERRDSALAKSSV